MNEIHFTVRKVRESDAESVAKYLNNKKIYDGTCDIPHPYTLEDAEDWVNKSLESGYDEPAEFLNFVIEIEGEAAGGIGIKEVARKEAEIGYWLAEPYWGKGIMSGVLKEFIDYAFNIVGLEKLVGDIFQFNKASQKVAEKNGFQKVGEKIFKKDGRKIETYIYAIEKCKN